MKKNKFSPILIIVMNRVYKIIWMEFNAYKFHLAKSWIHMTHFVNGLKKEDTFNQMWYDSCWRSCV